MSSYNLEQNNNNGGKNSTDSRSLVEIVVNIKHALLEPVDVAVNINMNS